MSTLLILFTDPATPPIYTLSLHDALPISDRLAVVFVAERSTATTVLARGRELAILSLQSFGLLLGLVACPRAEDRKSTRLNSSHPSISYAVFCLKKKIQYA